MLDPVRAKLKLVGVTAGAFAGGVLIASGLDWTAGSHAATLLQTTDAAVHRRRCGPVQELSQAFISIAESVTPAVVSIETERTPRRPAAAASPRRTARAACRSAFPFRSSRDRACRRRPAAPAS